MGNRFPAARSIEEAGFQVTAGNVSDRTRYRQYGESKRDGEAVESNALLRQRRS